MGRRQRSTGGPIRRSYPSAEVQSAYSTAPADRAKFWFRFLWSGNIYNSIYVNLPVTYNKIGGGGDKPNLPKRNYGLVILFYGVSTHIGSFNAESSFCLNFNEELKTISRSLYI